MPILGIANSYKGTYPIGSIGPGGGIVFYDAGSTLSWGRYLEAATTSSTPAWSDARAVWSGVTNVAIGTTSTAIGTGMSNTLAMVAQSSTANRAGTNARAYTGGGYSSSTTGWFLGSIDEMTQLYTQKAAGIVTGFFNDQYSTSSEQAANPANNIWYKSFSNGASLTIVKTGNIYVRPIRAF